MNTSNLDINGYIVLKAKLNSNSILDVLNCTNEDNLVKYDTLIHFINSTLFPTITNSVARFTNPIYTKFRYSNNNNSKDASTFHGDVYNHSNIALMPIYTCLCYFDDSQMELIPKSHIKNDKSTLELFNTKIQITLSRGDILIFHSNLYHRGINYFKKENRRLLQVFDVFPNKETYDKNMDKLYVVKTSALSLLTIAHYNVLINIVNFITFFLVNNDLQYKLNFQDIPYSEKKGRFISYEPEKRKRVDDLLEYDELNINIICDAALHTIPPSNYYLIQLFIMCIVIIFLYGFYFNYDTIIKILKKGLKR